MQQPKRFQAPTMAEAYDQVRREFGDSAVILSTRKAFAPGLFGQPGRQFVEVVARVPQEEPAAIARSAAERPTLAQDEAAHDLVRAIAEATAAAPLAAHEGPFAGFQAAAGPDDLPTPTRASRKRAAEPARASREASAADAEPARTAGPALPMPSADSAEPWSRQLDQMRTMLEQLVTERMDQRLEGGPAVLRNMRERLARHGMASTLAATLLGEVDVASARDDDALASAIERRLAAKLPPVVSTMGRRQRAIFLVGPGGAGKTTLAVRMALDLQRQGLKVVIAGTDVNRAGAPQQLMAFGSVTGLDIRLCYAPDELEEILAEAGVDVVIVDTPGHNGLRRDRMAELSSFLQAARQRQVLLTVPATMKASDLSEVVSAFSAIGLDGAAITRCDETSHFGHLAGVLVEAALGLALTTRSDQVSEGPIPGDNLALAEAIVRAQWTPAPTSMPSRRPAADRTLAKVG